MAFPGASETDLVLALQDAATGNRGWDAALARLAVITGARFAAMVTRLPDAPIPVDIVAAMPSGAALRIDPHAVGYALSDRMRPERIYASDDLAAVVDTGEGLSIQAALARLGAVSVVAIRVVVPDTVSIAFGIFGVRSFDAADGAVFRRLFPFLQASARTASNLWRERRRAAMARRAGWGWFLLDRAGIVLDYGLETVNAPRAVRVLPGTHGGRLAFADRTVEPALATILDRLAADPSVRVGGLWVGDEPAEYLCIAPPPREWAHDRRPVALATMHRIERIGPDCVDLLIDLYRLSPSEARLAAALAGGERLAVAAAGLGLTIETARNYSKRIFAKTGTHGQGDLVRLIWAGAIAGRPAG